MSGTKNDPQLVDPAPDVFIAGSGPIGCTYARTILDKAEKENLRVWMVDAGAQDNPIIGRHHKNSAKYQKDIDAFVNVIKGALQRVSVPPAETYMATLGAEAWSPAPGQCLVSAFHNPDQKPELNLPGCAITRTVGGMATHWTCACPIPHPDERKNSPIADDELLKLIDEAGELLNVNSNEYDKSIRHNLVKDVLAKAYPGKSEEGIERVKNLPLAVKRNENPAYVTWSGSDTVLGKKYAEQKDDRFTLLAEHKLVGFARDGEPVIGKGESQDFDQRLRYGTGKIKFAYVKDIKNNKYLAIPAKYYIVACGAIGTPQVLWNSGFGEHDERPNMAPELPALGRYLTEQSISFCQIVLKREFIDNLINPGGEVREEFRQKCQKHCEHPSKDPIPIPFNDPEPQVTMPYTRATPWHTQIHRDAFSYGDVGPRADPRLIVDLRFFGKQEPERNNYVTFSGKYTDIYGMPQATFNVTRNPVDSRRDQEMMLAMCEAANKLGPFLPGSYPQFMEPGLALHITGTTRLGKVDEGQLEHPPQEVLEYSVANQYSQVHGHKNLYVGGNNVIPDSTACNPTRTSSIGSLSFLDWDSDFLSAGVDSGLAQINPAFWNEPSPMKAIAVIPTLVALRLLLFTGAIPRYIQDDYQLASPVTSFARLKEGIFLSEKGIYPYTGGVFLHSPLFLALFSTVFPLSNLGSAILWSVLDGITAWCLVNLWRLRSSVQDHRKEVLIAVIFMLNPYNALPTLARSTSTIDTALTVLTLLFACQKRTGPALVALAALVHVSLPSVLVVAPVIMVLSNARAPVSMLANPTPGEKKEKDGGNNSSTQPSHWKVALKVVEWVMYMGVLAFSGRLAVGSWNWVWRSWGAVVTMSDATPNCGLWWYFFTEMFDHYRPFFLFTFSAHPLIYIAPICMKFRHDPFYAAFLLLGISAMLKSYPTLADAGLFISLMPLFPETFPYLRHPLPTFLLHLHSALLMPLASHLWLSQGTGNANFLYAATLVFGLANLAMVVDAVWAGLRAAFATEEGEEVVQL